jgi:Xaa-Pro dipeptidase
VYFVHRTGHGMGLEVHEPPSLHGQNTDPLPEGAMITVEPGVYIPGYGGVRIEDDVAVTASGPEVLTRAPVALELPLIGEAG